MLPIKCVWSHWLPSNRLTLDAEQVYTNVLIIWKTHTKSKHENPPARIKTHPHTCSLCRCSRTTGSVHGEYCTEIGWTWTNWICSKPVDFGKWLVGVCVCVSLAVYVKSSRSSAPRWACVCVWVSVSVIHKGAQLQQKHTQKNEKQSLAPNAFDNPPKSMVRPVPSAQSKRDTSIPRNTYYTPIECEYATVRTDPQHHIPKTANIDNRTTRLKHDKTNIIDATATAWRNVFCF